jgi:hypothetical protein
MVSVKLDTSKSQRVDDTARCLMPLGDGQAASQMLAGVVRMARLRRSAANLAAAALRYE